ncbi:conserved hypothetical protein [Xenorhabdus bovienii str. oregonense]|uniref:Uncharacterized protein n=1 Tax=Xenorhabdus bovienii str. oregonense TaxID=1398202 RepID=A0A077P534_XENBV|nr:hypothetical protein [Xenorhabdus bovienii]CDH04931.1 conserved hypothetical protein [Xenorhabdus bovienii str. oregonense]
MTHQISKSACGVDTLLRIRRWWALRKLRGHWRDDQFFLKLARQPKYKWISDHFNFYERYQFLRLLTEHEQRRGTI